MATTAIVSYDDTPNDHDALMLGRVLAAAGAQLTLAYVRHSTQAEREREELEEHEAEALLDRGARWIGDPDVERRVVVSGSTGEGLKWLAEQQGADVVVFGSDYRTAAGHVAPGRSAQTLLEGGPAALAFAPANYRGERTPQIRTIGVLAVPGDDAAIETARELAAALDAKLTRDEPRVDLLVVGSRSEAPDGRLMLTAQAQNAIEEATSPVLAIARGVPVRFDALVAA
ncbi:MAG: universal stress protein [Solirubrobacterales bacterium]|nr:universal stress protein [Solirubrobacterales bacterium]MBV9837955.1 universal stress protein [Solirubrobacterales bacterium]